MEENNTELDVSIKLAKKIADNYAFVKRLWPDDWEERLNKVAEPLKQIAEKRKISVAKLVVEILTEKKNGGTLTDGDVLWCTASIAHLPNK